MPSVGIREFKARASHYVAMACGGEEVTITKWGRTMARLVGEPRRHRPLRDQLAPLAAEGLVTLPALGRRRPLPKPVAVGGRPLSELVLEERR